MKQSRSLSPIADKQNAYKNKFTGNLAYLKDIIFSHEF
ncbi:hypothetical protein FM109_03730 [Vibrio casei]|nr:hypothetical protein FM109_03730 [Vibrio casei]